MSRRDCSALTRIKSSNNKPEKLLLIFHWIEFCFGTSFGVWLLEKNVMSHWKTQKITFHIFLNTVNKLTTALIWYDEFSFYAVNLIVKINITFVIILRTRSRRRTRKVVVAVVSGAPLIRGCNTSALNPIMQEITELHTAVIITHTYWLTLHFIQHFAADDIDMVWQIHWFLQSPASKMHRRLGIRWFIWSGRLGHIKCIETRYLRGPDRVAERTRLDESATPGI